MGNHVLLLIIHVGMFAGRKVSSYLDIRIRARLRLGFGN